MIRVVASYSSLINNLATGGTGEYRGIIMGNTGATQGGTGMMVNMTVLLPVIASLKISALRPFKY